MISVTVEKELFTSPPDASPSTAMDNLACLMEGDEAGLALFDASLALISCNSCYADLFDYQPSDLLPGTSLTDMIRHNLERGNTSTDETENVLPSFCDAFGPEKRTGSSSEPRVATGCESIATAFQTVCWSKPFAS